jgi:hypothetical protein
LEFLLFKKDELCGIDFLMINWAEKMAILSFILLLLTEAIILLTEAIFAWCLFKAEISSKKS